nr:putative ribonuclease H-like domain-containing protein [Tanacetum cinerariifolium]
MYTELSKLCIDFIKHQGPGTLFFDQVYVDDIIFGSTNKAWCDEFEVLMKGEFEISAMGELTFFLGLQVKQLPDASRPDIMFAISACSRHQVTPMTSHLNAVKKIFNYLKGQPNLGLWYPRDSPFQLEAYSDSDYAGFHGDRKSKSGGCQFLSRRLISWQCKKQTIVATSSIEAEYVTTASCCCQVFLLVVLVHADGMVPAGSYTIPTGSYSFMLLDWLHIRYALTHHPPTVFDSLVKQFWAIASVRTLKAGPTEIVATIDGNEVVVTESLIRTKLQLNDETRLYEFTLHDVLDGMREIVYPTDGSLTFYKAKLSPQWRFLIHTLIHSPMLVVPAGGDGADAVAAGAATTNEVTPPLPPPVVPPTHTSSSTPGPSTTTQDTPVRDPTPVTKPTSSPMREPTTTATPESPRLPSPHPCTRLEEVDPTTISTRPPTVTAAGGVEDSTALTDLSLTLDRLKGILKQSKRRMVLSDSEGKEDATKELEINLDALHELARMSLGGDTTVEAAYTSSKLLKMLMPPHMLVIIKMRFLKLQPCLSDVQEPSTDTIPAGDSIPTDAQTIPAGSTPIFADSYKDPAGQAAAATPSSSVIPAADKGKALIVDDSVSANFLTEQERVDWLELMAKIATNSELSKQLLGDNVNEDNMNERLEEHVKPKPTLEVPSAKRARQEVPQDVPAASSQVPVSVHAAPSIVADVSVSAASTITVDVSATPTLPVDVTEATTTSIPDPPPPHATLTEIPTEHTVDVSTTPLYLRKRRKQITKKRVTLIVDATDADLIKFDSASESDGDPSPNAPYASWEMIVDGRVIYMFIDVPYPLSEATIECMLRHGLEVPKVLVRGDLTMAEQLGDVMIPPQDELAQEILLSLMFLLVVPAGLLIPASFWLLLFGCLMLFCFVRAVDIKMKSSSFPVKIYLES